MTIEKNTELQNKQSESSVSTDRKDEGPPKLNKSINRLERWYWNVILGATPLLVSCLIHRSRGHSWLEAFNKTSELSIFILVISFSVMIDLFEILPVIGKIRAQSFFILLLFSCFIYALLHYGISLKIDNDSAVQAIDPNVTEVSFVAFGCVGLGTLVEIIIAGREKKI